MVTGTAANTFGTLVSTATGGSTVGTSAVTLAALTSTATGRMNPVGTSASTLLAATSTASGSTVKGTSAVTLATIVSASTGTSAGGSSAVTLSALTSTATGKRGNAGTSAATLATITSAGTGRIDAIGVGASTLTDATTAGRGGFHALGSGRGTVGYNFLADTMPAEFVWSGTTETPGTIVEHADADGGMTLALQFPDLEDSQESYFELPVWATAINTTLLIRYETDSENGYDKIRGYLDGVELFVASGQDEGWFEYSAVLDPGDYTLKLRFNKDSSVSEGADTAWISTLVFPYGDLAITGTGEATLGLLTTVAVGRVSPRRVRRVSLHGSTYLRTRAA
jgi:hypothetical protein